nr:Ig-like domain-containing protein [Herbaspirillum sp. ASV7]
MNSQFSKIGQFSQWLRSAFLRQFSELQAQEKLPSAAFPHPAKVVSSASEGDAVVVKPNAAATPVVVEPLPKAVVAAAPTPLMAAPVVNPVRPADPVVAAKPPVAQPSPPSQPQVEFVPPATGKPVAVVAPVIPAVTLEPAVVASKPVVVGGQATPASGGAAADTLLPSGVSKLGPVSVLPSAVAQLSVTTDAAGGPAPTAAKTMSFTVTGAKAGAVVEIYADALIFGGMRAFLIGSGKPDEHGVVSIDTGRFNDRFVNFQARQTVDGIGGPLVAVKQASGKSFAGMNWDHGQPWVDITAPGRDAHPNVEQPFNMSFTFNKAPAKFDEHNVIVTGGTLSNVRALDSDGLVYVGSFKASSVYAGTVSFQVKDASYTDVAGNVGWGSRTLSLDLEHKGVLQIAGGSGRDGAVQAGDVLSASVIDFDGVDPGRAVAYTWRWTDEHGKLLKSGTSGGDTYTVRAEDVGQHLSVQAVYVDRFNVAEDVSWVSPQAVTRSNHPGVATILVDGHASRDGSLRPGDHLTVKVQDADGVDAQAIHYQWVASKNGAIAGATGKSFDLPEDGSLTGQTLSVQVSYRDGHAVDEDFSTAALPVKASNHAASVSIVGGDHGVFHAGDVLTAQVADADGVASPVRYVWSVGQMEVGHEQSYRLSGFDLDSAVSVKAIFQDGAGNAESAYQGLTTTSRAAQREGQGDVLIDGDPIVGAVLTANLGYVSDIHGIQAGSMHVEWYALSGNRVKTMISPDHYRGADGSQLVVSSDLAQEQIFARAVYTDGLGQQAMVETSVPPIVTWSLQYDVGHLSFVGLTKGSDQAALMSRAPGSDIYILDVNGDGKITSADATPYLSSLDAKGGMSFGVEGGRARASLLAADDPMWAKLMSSPSTWGSATGAKGSDFWSASPGMAAGSHQIWAHDGGDHGTAGAYQQNAASVLNDASRLHYNVFHVSVLPA